MQGWDLMGQCDQRDKVALCGAFWGVCVVFSVCATVLFSVCATGKGKGYIKTYCAANA